MSATVPCCFAEPSLHGPLTTSIIQPHQTPPATLRQTNMEPEKGLSVDYRPLFKGALARFHVSFPQCRVQHALCSNQLPEHSQVCEHVPFQVWFSFQTECLLLLARCTFQGLRVVALVCSCGEGRRGLYRLGVKAKLQHACISHSRASMASHAAYTKLLAEEWAEGSSSPKKEGAMQPSELCGEQALHGTASTPAVRRRGVTRATETPVPIQPPDWTSWRQDQRVHGLSRSDAAGQRGKGLHSGNLPVEWERVTMILLPKLSSPLILHKNSMQVDPGLKPLHMPNYALFTGRCRQAAEKSRGPLT